MSLALSILPIFLIIATGYALARSGVLPKGEWASIETLSFRVLIPAVLILAISETDLTLTRFGGFMITLMLTWAVMICLAMLPRLISHERLDNPSFTTIFQAGSRWNAFVALAAAEQFTGEAGIAALAVAIALLIPSVNVACIVVLTTFGPKRGSVKDMVGMVFMNPLVQACIIGLALYFSGLTLPNFLIDTLEMIGRGALAVGLLAVGAGVSLRRLARWDWKVAVSVALRPILAPCVFAGIATVLALSPVLTLAGVLAFAAPAAVNGHVVAKKMGGNADLYADVMTWQVLVSLLVIPFWAWAIIG